MEKHSVARLIGAPPLRRFLQRQIETRLALGIIGGEIPENSTATFSVREGELVLSTAPSAETEMLAAR